MPTSYNIDDALSERVQALAGKRSRSPDWLMREAVEQYVGREEAREGFVAEANAAWGDYRADGKHVSAQEADDWLASWGTEAETPAPNCHD